MALALFLSSAGYAGGESAAPAQANEDWSLPAELAKRAGQEIAGRIAKWNTLEPAAKHRLLLECIGILGDDADVVCLKVLRHETSPEVMSRASVWFLENGRREDVGPLMEIAGGRRQTVVVYAAAMLAVRYGRNDDAISLLEKQQPPDISCAGLLADIYEKTGNAQKAEEALRTLLRLEPDNMAFSARLAAMLLGRGDRKGALETLRETSGRREDSVEAQLDLVSALNRIGFTAEAATAAKAGGKRFGDYRFHRLLADFALAAGKKDEAVACYYDALGVVTREADLILVSGEMSRLAARLADFDKFFKELKAKAANAVEQGHYNDAVRYNFLLAWIATGKGNAEEAKSACRAVWGNSNRAAALSFEDLPSVLGGMLARVEGWEAAANIYKGVLEYGPAKTAYRLALGYCYLKMGKKEEALSEWRKIVDGEGAHEPRNYLILVQVLLAGGMTEEAEKTSWDAVGAFPADRNLIAQRLRILIAGGNYSEAAKLIGDTLHKVEPAHQAEWAAAFVLTLPETADLNKLIDAATGGGRAASEELAGLLMRRADGLAAENRIEDALALYKKILLLTPTGENAEKAREKRSRLETKTDNGGAGNK